MRIQPFQDQGFRVWCVRELLLPSLVYLLVFTVMSWPWMGSFNTHFFADRGDGLQNVWNMWWVNMALTEMHALPWYTGYLHYPQGVSLLAHTLNPFNGIVGSLLQTVLSLVQAFNAMVVFSFVAGGVTAFWLAGTICRSRQGRMLVGGMFTFSSYHFAHAHGHMQLVALEWLPLFLLFFHHLLVNRGFIWAVGSASALFLVLLCDYYYFFYCIMMACLMIVWSCLGPGRPRFAYLKSLVYFFVMSCLFTGPLVVALLVQIHLEGHVGIHDPVQNSMDLLAPFVPGEFSRFNSLSDSIRPNFTSNASEQSVYLGWGVIVLMIIAVTRRRHLDRHGLELWLGGGFAFFLLSLGPSLTIMGNQHDSLGMPYRVLEYIFPFLRTGGMPIRFTVMISLCCAIIAACGWEDLWSRGGFARRAAGILLFIVIFELWPSQLPLTRVEIPGYVGFLRDSPEPGAVIDFTTEPVLEAFDALYYQTVHERPMAFGYISREPYSRSNQRSRFIRLADTGQYHVIRRRYGFRYMVSNDAGLEDTPGVRLVHAPLPGEPYVYDLAGIDAIGVDRNGSGINPGE